MYPNLIPAPAPGPPHPPPNHIGGNAPPQPAPPLALTHECGRTSFLPDEVWVQILSTFPLGSLANISAFACTSKPALRVARRRMALELIMAPWRPDHRNLADLQRRLDALRAQVREQGLAPQEIRTILDALAHYCCVLAPDERLPGFLALLHAGLLVRDEAIFEDWLDCLLTFTAGDFAQANQSRDLMDAIVRFCATLPFPQGPTCHMLSRVMIPGKHCRAFTPLESYDATLAKLESLPHECGKRVVVKMLRLMLPGETLWDTLPGILSFAARIDRMHGIPVLCAAAKRVGVAQRAADWLLADASLVLIDARALGEDAEAVVLATLAESLPNSLRGYAGYMGVSSAPDEAKVCAVYDWLWNEVRTLPPAARDPIVKRMAESFFVEYKKYWLSDTGQRLLDHYLALPSAYHCAPVFANVFTCLLAHENAGIMNLKLTVRVLTAFAELPLPVMADTAMNTDTPRTYKPKHDNEVYQAVFDIVIAVASCLDGAQAIRLLERQGEKFLPWMEATQPAAITKLAETAIARAGVQACADLLTDLANRRSGIPRVAQEALSYSTRIRGSGFYSTRNE